MLNITIKSHFLLGKEHTSPLSTDYVDFNS